VLLPYLIECLSCLSDVFVSVLFVDDEIDDTLGHFNIIDSALFIVDNGYYIVDND